MLRRVQLVAELPWERRPELVERHAAVQEVHTLSEVRVVPAATEPSQPVPQGRACRRRPQDQELSPLGLSPQVGHNGWHELSLRFVIGAEDVRLPRVPMPSTPHTR